MALTDIRMPTLTILTHEDQLTRSIFERSAAIGSNLADEFQAQMVLLVRDVVNITPPNTGSARGGLQAGQAAITRDLFQMGFVPVTIKGHRTISHVPAGNVKGRKAVPITPVQVRTHVNPKFEDPDTFHLARLRRKSQMHRRRVSRGGAREGGGAQAFYVRASQFRSMKSRLFKEIGTLAAAWLPGLSAINNGNLPSWVPGWIKRHASDVTGRGFYDFNFDPDRGALYVHLINAMPESAGQEAADTQRRVEAAKGYRINAIRRGLEGRAKRIARAYHGR